MSILFKIAGTKDWYNDKMEALQRARDKSHKTYLEDHNKLIDSINNAYITSPQGASAIRAKAQSGIELNEVLNNHNKRIFERKEKRYRTKYNDYKEKVKHEDACRS